MKKIINMVMSFKEICKVRKLEFGLLSSDEIRESSVQEIINRQSLKKDGTNKGSL